MILMLVILSVAMMSCDGRISKHRALERSVSEFNSKSEVSFSKYIPESYNERVTDSILSHGYQVSIKISTDLNAAIAMKSESDGIESNTLLRHHNLQIIVNQNDRLVLRKKFDHSALNQMLGQSDSFVLRAAFLDQEASLLKNNVQIRLYMLGPTSNKRAYYIMAVDNNGNFKISPDHVRT